MWLLKRGVRTCTEEPGGSRLREIARLVSTSRFTLPVLTPRFTAGHFECEELQTMMAQQLGLEDGRVRLLPIVREACEAELGVRMHVHLDIIRDQKVAPGIERIVRALRECATPRPTPG